MASHCSSPPYEPHIDNYLEPRKRPLSPIARVIFKNADGNFEVALGASGGSRVFGTVFQGLLGLDWGLDISQAIEYRRLLDQLFPSLVAIKVDTLKTGPRVSSSEGITGLECSPSGRLRSTLSYDLMHS